MARAKTDNRSYRYRITEVWGDVPPKLAAMVDDPDAFLLYRTWKGTGCQQDLLRDGECTGGWYMTYVDRGPELPKRPRSGAAVVG